MKRPTRRSSPSSSSSSYSPAPIRIITNVLLPSLLLSLLISTINATPYLPPASLASQVLSAPLSRRSSADGDGSIHIPAGGIAGMVIGIVIIAILSVAWCCPCWKWIPRGGKPGKRGGRGRGTSDPEGARGPELGGSEVVEMGPGDGNELGTSEGIAKDGPPRYEEVMNGTANTAGRSELDGKMAG